MLARPRSLDTLKRNPHTASGNTIKISGSIVINDNYLSSGIDIGDDDVIYDGVIEASVDGAGVDYLLMSFEVGFQGGIRNWHSRLSEAPMRRVSALCQGRIRQC